MTVALQAVILALAAAASMAHDRSRTTGKWTRWATSVKTGREVKPARKWHHRPLWQRAVIQGGAVVLAGETALGLFTLPGVTLAVLIIASLSAAAWGLAWTCLRLRDHARVIGHVTIKQTLRHLPAVIARWWNHRRGYTTRLRDSLQPVFGVIPWQIKVTPDRSLVTIRPPYTFAGHDHERLAVVSTIGSLMHREGLEPDWTGLHGRKPQIRFHLIEPPPGILYWDNIAARIGGVGDSDLVTGIGHRGKLITASLKSDSPHLGIGMGTGAGKSNLAAFWLVQRLRRGDFALIVDGKRFSHPWAFKDMAAAYALLPNVAYVRSISDIHDALVWLGLELAERNKYVEQRINAKGDLLGEAPKRLFGVMEELNYIVPQLKSYWARQRDLLMAIAKEQGTEKPPKESPALMALAAVAAAGRAVGIHLIFIGQRLDAEVLGSSGSKGGAVRGNIGVRALARYDEPAWKMQAGGVPMPPSPSVEGRIQLWIGGEVHECQVPWMDHKHAISELRELALGGIVTPCPEGMPGRVSVLDAPHSPIQAAEQPVVLGKTPIKDNLIGLSQAHATGLFNGRSLSSVQRASTRGGFPEPVRRQGRAYLYDFDQLAAWQAERELVQ